MGNRGTGEVQMTPKPLTKERREEMEALLVGYFTKGALPLMVEDALAAEAYWREAVKNMPLLLKDSTGQDKQEHCLWCSGTVKQIGLLHAVDCPWVLANE